MSCVSHIFGVAAGSKFNNHLPQCGCGCLLQMECLDSHDTYSAMEDLLLEQIPGLANSEVPVAFGCA